MKNRVARSLWTTYFHHLSCYLYVNSDAAVQTDTCCVAVACERDSASWWKKSGWSLDTNLLIAVDKVRHPMTSMNVVPSSCSGSTACINCFVSSRVRSSSTKPFWLVVESLSSTPVDQVFSGIIWQRWCERYDSVNREDWPIQNNNLRPPVLYVVVYFVTGACLLLLCWI